LIVKTTAGKDERQEEEGGGKKEPREFVHWSIVSLTHWIIPMEK
jgi:hypothetical protein